MAKRLNLDEAVDIIHKQDEVLKSILDSNTLVGVVLRPDSQMRINDEGEEEWVDTVLVSIHGSEYPTNMSVKEGLKVSPGDTVMVWSIGDGRGYSVVAKSKHPVETGAVCQVIEYLDKENMVVVRGASEREKVHPGRKTKEELEPGTDVVVFANSVIVSAAPLKKNYTATKATGVSWDSIGGLKEEKEQIIDAIEGPIVNADLYKKYGQKPAKGILMFGPPGNGRINISQYLARP